MHGSVCTHWLVGWLVCWPDAPAGRSSGSPTSQLINHQAASHLVHSSHAMSNYFFADEGCNMSVFSEENYDPVIPAPIFIKTATFKHKKEESVYMHAQVHTRLSVNIQFNSIKKQSQNSVNYLLSSLALKLSLSLWNEIKIFMKSVHFKIPIM